MRQQQALWADVAIVENYAAALDVDDFGGMWWNNDRDPVAFVLAVTNRVGDHTAALRRLVEHPEQVEAVEVRHSQQKLRTLQDELDGLRSDYPISMTYPEASAGVVVVALSRDDADIRAELELRFGDTIRVERGTSFGWAV
jgi:hypothetical protein